MFLGFIFMNGLRGSGEVWLVGCLVGIANFLFQDNSAGLFLSLDFKDQNEKQGGEK